MIYNLLGLERVGSTPGSLNLFQHDATGLHVCVGHTGDGELRKNGWTDRDAVWGWLMWVQGTMS